MNFSNLNQYKTHKRREIDAFGNRLFNYLLIAIVAMLIISFMYESLF